MQGGASRILQGGRVAFAQADSAQRGLFLPREMAAAILEDKITGILVDTPSCQSPNQPPQTLLRRLQFSPFPPKKPRMSGCGQKFACWPFKWVALNPAGSTSSWQTETHSLAQLNTMWVSVPGSALWAEKPHLGPGSMPLRGSLPQLRQPSVASACCLWEQASPFVTLPFLLVLIWLLQSLGKSLLFSPGWYSPW